MGKLGSTIRSEIQRLAKREIRATFVPLRGEVRAMRIKLSTLFKNFSVLERLAKEQMEKAPKPGLAATPEEVKASRLSPERISLLRKKLGLSQREMGSLVGASFGTVLSWEKGKSKPKPDKKAALVALRKMRKRDVKKLLALKVEESENSKAQRKPGRAPRPKKRAPQKRKPTPR